ncbi:S8 family peptidase [Paenibacillus sp. GCM10012303]|uniref:S8 family peptidase n=1 Tax=Paenibacillus sp. GCM10012303 TaxID=3317340 RepID=UPI0036208ECE
MDGPSWLQTYASKMNRPLRNKVRHIHASGNPSAAIRVIIQLKRRVTPARLNALQQHTGSLPLPIIRRLPLIRSVASNVSMPCLERMCSWNGIGKIYLDGIKKTSLYIATPSIGATAVRRKTGLTGKGINIAVIDTGVYPHPDLTRPVNRIVAFKDWIHGRKKPYDDNGHGTHIAGDCAGNGWESKGIYRGPAPEAGIVGVKVLDRQGSGYDSTIIKGIEWCILHRRRLKLRILSMSLGGPVNTVCSDDPLCQAVEKAVRAGLVAVIAAGNSGPGRRTIESPGSAPSAITVGAVDDHRSIRQADDSVMWYSSRGPARGGRSKPDLVAPGETIVSLRAPGSVLDREYPYLRVGHDYFILSGTSISTPLVSGAAAQLLQRYPSLSPRQVKAALKKNAFRLGLGPNVAGSGIVNVRFLLNQRNPRSKRRPSKGWVSK